MTGAEALARMATLDSAMARHGVPRELAGLFGRFVHAGLHPGSWAWAVLCNDLDGSVRLADSEARQHLVGVVLALHEGAPAWAWGSGQRAMDWHRLGGLQGMLRGPSGPHRAAQGPGRG